MKYRQGSCSLSRDYVYMASGYLSTQVAGFVPVIFISSSFYMLFVYLFFSYSPLFTPTSHPFAKANLFR